MVEGEIRRWWGEKGGVGNAGNLSSTIFKLSFSLLKGDFNKVRTSQLIIKTNIFD